MTAEGPLAQEGLIPQRPPFAHAPWCTDHSDFDGACQSDIVSVPTIEPTGLVGPSINLQIGQAVDDTPRLHIDAPERPISLVAASHLAHEIRTLVDLAVSSYIAQESAR